MVRNCASRKCFLDEIMNLFDVHIDFLFLCKRVRVERTTKCNLKPFPRPCWTEILICDTMSDQLNVAAYKRNHRPVPTRHEKLINHVRRKMVYVNIVCYLEQKVKRMNAPFMHACFERSENVNEARWRKCTSRANCRAYVWKRGKLNVIRASGALENICCPFESISIYETQYELSFLFFPSVKIVCLHTNPLWPFNQRMWITVFLYIFPIHRFRFFADVLENRSVGFRRKIVHVRLCRMFGEMNVVTENRVSSENESASVKPYRLMLGHDSICRCHWWQHTEISLFSVEVDIPHYMLFTLIEAATNHITS